MMLLLFGVTMAYVDGRMHSDDQRVLSNLLSLVGVLLAAFGAYNIDYRDAKRERSSVPDE